MTDGNHTTVTPESQEVDPPITLPFIEGLIDSLREHFEGQITNLKTELTLAQPKAETEDSVDDPVQLRIKKLEQKLAEYEAEKVANAEKERKQQYLNKLSEELDKYPNLQFRQAVVNQLASSYEGSKEVDGRFISKDGKDLPEVVKEWFSTDYGKHHLKPQTVGSTGLSPTAEGVLPGQPKMTIQEKLAQGL